MSTPVRVVFIGGAGRSGSTLLERLLATAPGVVAAGEVVHLWDRGVRDDQLCGCERHFHDCPHWQRVGQHAFDGWDTPAAERAAVLRHRVDRQRRLAALVSPALTTPSRRREIHEYAIVLGRLYTAIAAVGDGHTVIDSSKHGSTAHLLRHVPDIDLRVVLMVRHPGGVAHSWSRAVRRPEITDADVAMPVHSSWRASADWLLRSLEVQSSGWFGAPVTVLRYEDLLADPTACLERLADDLGLPSAPVVTDHRAVLDVDHTVAGNPMRFRTGPLELRRDDAWRDRLDRRDRRVVDLVTRPLAASYGYERAGAA